VFVAAGALYAPEAFGIGHTGNIAAASLLEMSLGVAIGAVTFTGSVIAFAKLSGRMSGKPIILPARHLINLGLALLLVVLIFAFCGSGGDPQGHAQNTKDLLGDMLRLDIDHGTPYAIPSGATGNPFAANAVCPADNSSTHDCPEIYAWGLRNPWRWSFDTATGDLWVADVGQNRYEEVDRLQRGGNYGWNCREGTHPYTDSAPAASCATATGLIDPVIDYDHSQGDETVIGGYVYHGSAAPGLAGAYVFGDFISGRVWTLTGSGQSWTRTFLFDTASNDLSSFGQDQAGELYVARISTGEIARIQQVNQR